VKISIVGCGRLGSPMSAYYAARGHSVVAIDHDDKIIDSFNRGGCPINETGLSELLRHARLYINFTTSYARIKDTDITFIIVPTPTDESGEYYNGFVNNALKEVCNAIKYKTSYHLIVVTSTVKLGSMRNEFTPLCESILCRKIEDGWSLVYNPEFIALGNVIHDLAKPDSILIGMAHPRAGDLLEKFYLATCENNPSIHRMSWENAEIAKIMLNVFVVNKISLANTFAQVCDNIKGGNIDAVTNFLGMDSRIGLKYLKGGLGYAGSCFPRDNRAFVKASQRVGVDIPINRMTDDFNKKHNVYALERALNGIPKDSKIVSLLGVSFKPNTYVTEESPAIQMADKLIEIGYEVKAYDPQAKIEKVKMCGSVAECLKDSDLAIIVTPWDVFKDLKPTDFSEMRNPNVYDCWRIMGREQLIDSGIRYRALGWNND
jgi:UDPglucose 6-dehydrogenase